MFGENYLLIENTDSRGRRVEQWVAENAGVENIHLDDPALLELAEGAILTKTSTQGEQKLPVSMLFVFRVALFSASKDFSVVRVCRKCSYLSTA